MQYHIIEDSKIDALELKVQKYLSEGWELAGGIAVRSVDYIRYYQAVIKK